MILTNQNFFHEEIKSRLNSKNCLQKSLFYLRTWR